MFNHELGSIDKRDQLAVQRELAAAYREAGSYQEAQKQYMDLLPALKAVESHEVSCELAELCLLRDQLPQAETLCRDVLASDAPEAAKAKARELLGQALMRSQQYSQAVTALVTPASSGGKGK